MLVRALTGRRQARLATKRLAGVREARRSLAGEPFDYERVVRFLVDLGCDEQQVREGSMPSGSLDFCGRLITDNVTARPVLGLHIGNFVGVSLAYFTDLVAGMRPDSVIVSVDPNIPHRGIARPQEKVMALLDHLHLHANCMVLTGYSMEKTAKGPMGCSQQLRNLALLGKGAFDFCVLDGDHEGNYVRRETQLAAPLLKPDGLLLMDDVSICWPDLLRVYESGADAAFVKCGWDGRVGVLRKSGS